MLLGCRHHFLEVRAVEVAAGKALVFIYNYIIKSLLTVVNSDVLLAQLHLISDALALSRELGFTGINRDTIFILSHIISPCQMLCAYTLLYREVKIRSNFGEVKIEKIRKLISP